MDAAELIADAVIVAERLGLDSTRYRVRARELFAACSAMPPFGDGLDVGPDPALRPA